MLDFAARECPGAVLRSGYLSTDGESPSGKAAAFGAAIRRFESSLPSQAARPPGLQDGPRREQDEGEYCTEMRMRMRSLLTSTLTSCYLAARK